MMQFFLSLLFPRRCLFCERVISESRILCQEHLRSIPFIKEPFCHKCGKSLDNDEEEFCFDCCQDKHFFDKGMACFEYKSYVAKSIFRFKYKQSRYLAKGYAEVIYHYLGGRVHILKCDMIIGVPISKKKLGIRGYNQSDILAKELALLFNIRWQPNLVIRKKETPPLKSLRRSERKKALSGVFTITDKSVVKDKIILIVDDIYTTGSTIDEIAKLLKENGAQKVYFLALSIGKGI